MTAGLTGEQLKACCAAGYSSDVVATLLGPSYHPGGKALTRRLLDRLALRPGDRLVDVASGIGTTAVLAAGDYALDVEGVDLSAANVALATGSAAAAELSGRVRFHHGDAESLPVPAGAFDAVVCECALCTFPDKPTAAVEMARVLRPGGRVGITDVAAETARLPAELTGVTAWVACVADARPATEYAGLLDHAGLRVTAIERHPAALRRMIEQIRARLDLLKMTARQRLDDLGLDPDAAAPALRAAEAAVHDGMLDYVLITAEKPCD